MLDDPNYHRTMETIRSAKGPIGWILRHPAEFYVPMFAASFASMAELVGADSKNALIISGAVYGAIKVGQHLHDFDSKRNPVYKAIRYFENRRGEKKVTEYFSLYEPKPA